MVSGSVTILNREIVPKRMQLDHDEWVCIRPEEYALILDHIRLGELLLGFAKLKESELKILFERICAEDTPRGIEGLKSETHDRVKSNVQIDEGLIAEAESVLSDPNSKYISLGEFVKIIAAADLRKARKQKKISQKQLAKMAGLTQPQVSNLEKDPHKMSVQTLRKIANALGVKIFV